MYILCQKTILILNTLFSLHNVYSVPKLFLFPWFLVAVHNVAVVCNPAVLGQDMTCNCTADGNPTPSFQWRASNGLFLGNGRSYTLKLVERTLSDYNFTCVAVNGFGPNASDSRSFDIKGKLNINFVLGN